MIKQTSKMLSRSAGIVLHPTSLKTSFGIGDFGPAAFEFIDFLEKAGQHYWQMLPLGPTGYADSPYQNYSAFAGNTMLISPEELQKIGLLTSNSIDAAIRQAKGKSEGKIDYDFVRNLKDPLFKEAFTIFQQKNKNNDLVRQFQTYCQTEASWLDDFALFYTLKAAHNLQSWITWEKPYITRDSTVLMKWQQDHKDDIQFCKFLQWIFETQLKSLQEYAHTKHIDIIGDIAIFVAHDSADVWAHPQLFYIHPDGNLEYQAGVPPDYFSKTGQLWGNPLYRWDVLKKTKYAWFIARFKRIFTLVDWIRIDHFRGFEAYWRIPGNETTAINGQWIKAPGKDLFNTVLRQLGQLPIIAEDLGVITPEVEALRDNFHFPGMRVMQFAFGSDAKNPHLPHNYVKNSIVYTGTHDNDTLVGWWDNKASKEEKVRLCQYFDTEAKDISQVMISALYRSVACLAILPLQDVLKQGSEARMNIPSTPSGNWVYQVPDNAFTDERAQWICNLVKLYGR